MTLDQLLEALQTAKEHGFGNALVGVQISNSDPKTYCALAEVKASRSINEWPTVTIIAVAERPVS